MIGLWRAASSTRSTPREPSRSAVAGKGRIGELSSYFCHCLIAGLNYLFFPYRLKGGHHVNSSHEN
jgi:hypothetical protein